MFFNSLLNNNTDPIKYQNTELTSSLASWFFCTRLFVALRALWALEG